MKNQVTLKEAIEKLNEQGGKRFIKLFEHGSLEVEIYAPVEKDLQTPHSRDEVYIVAAGSGTFLNGNERTKFSTGDFLLVPAGVEHRFENFTDDFLVWVIFYGPEGGEK